MADISWFKFYPGDWLNDLELRSCSPLARAAWIDSICVMHNAKPYGYLLINGRNTSLEVIARVLGWEPKKYQKAIDELKEKGVARVDDEHRIYCQRMLKDVEKRKVQRERGLKGGNPYLVKPEVNPKDNPLVNLKVKLEARGIEARGIEVEKECPNSDELDTSLKVWNEEEVGYRLAKYLLECITENDPQAKVPKIPSKQFDSWCLEFDRLVRIDKRPEQEAGELIEWCQTGWWKPYILSAKKFREKYTQLLLAKGRK